MFTLALLVAGATFSDDFESGQLYVGNGGEWESVATFFPGVTLDAAAAGAHRGRFGAHIVDQNAISDAGNGPEAWLIQPVSGFGDAVFLRYWVRQALVGVGGVEIDFVNYDPDGGAQGTSGTVVRVPSGGLQIGGYALTGGLVVTEVDAGLISGQWHLLELGTTGLGSTDGGRHLWVDGRLSGSVSGLDFTSRVASSISVGENYATPLSTTGTLDFDDVAVSGSPNATFIAVSAPTTADRDACVPVEIALTSVAGAPARAPYDVVAVTFGASASHFSDSDCTVPTTGVTVSKGAASGTGYITVASPGDYALTALHPDFLSRPPVRLGVGYGKLSAGCGCGSSVGAVPLVLLLLAAGLRRRRSVRARSRPSVRRSAPARQSR